MTNTLPACRDCQYSSPGMVYPMLFCNLRGILVNPGFTCVKATGKK